jgi:hypothetical protein
MFVSHIQPPHWLNVHYADIYFAMRFKLHSLANDCQLTKKKIIIKTIFISSLFIYKLFIVVELH